MISFQSFGQWGDEQTMTLSLKVIGLVKEADKRSKNYDLGFTSQGQCHTECLEGAQGGSALPRDKSEDL